MSKLISIYVSPLVLLISIVVPVGAAAHEERDTYPQIFNGDNCNVRNPTTQNAASLRREYGMLRNTSEGLTATISCPIPLVLPSYNDAILESSIELSLTFLNSHPSEEQKFSCQISTVRENRGSDGNIYVSVEDEQSESEIVQAGLGGNLTFTVSAGVVDPVLGLIRPVVTCGLPPSSSIVSYTASVKSVGSPL